MKKSFLLIYFIFLASQISAQWDISASMGLDFKSSSSFRDYVNTYFSQSGNQMQSFKTAVNFSGEVDYKLSKSFAIGLDYGIQIDSYDSPFGIGGVYEISYSFHRPSIMAYYVIPGEGYQFKLGGGAGPRFVSLSERIYSQIDYTARGGGIVLKAEGNTMLSKNFYALIGADFRYDFTGDISNGTNTIVNKSTRENLNLNSISFGIYLGITFLL